MENLLVLVPFDGDYSKRVRQIAGERCETAFFDPAWTRAAYEARLGAANIVLGDPDPDDLPLMKNLRLHQTTWAGVEHYAAHRDCYRGATLCNMSGAYGPVIAEYAVASILALCWRFSDYQTAQESGVWRGALPGKTLEGANVLIVGAGDIGRALAARLRPFVQTIVGIRRGKDPLPEAFDRTAAMDELDRLLPEADVVACCLPRTPATEGVFNAARFCRMKQDAIFVNVGRGSLVVTDDLCAALEQGRLWGAALDVTDPEPLPPEHPLWKQPRARITPHISGNMFGPGSPTERRIWDLCLKNLENYLSGRPLENVVDFAAGYRALHAQE